MGSSKTAMALMKKFSFEEHRKNVLLLKPSLDDRDGKTIVKSRVGLFCEALVIDNSISIIENFKDCFKNFKHIDVIIVDEAQFLKAQQVDELRELANNGTMVMCYGLKTDFMGYLFEGSKRLFEVADSIREIQSPCKCGRKAIVSAKICGSKIIYSGDQIDIGGNEKYEAMCYQCWVKNR